MKFTVLLLYPDYMAETFGHETYMTTVEADSVRQAIALAQAAVVEENRAAESRPEDYFVLLVIPGEHKDIKDQAEEEPVPEENDVRGDFHVSLTRIGYGHKELSFIGVTREEARRLALDQAGDHEFSEKDAEYVVESITKG